MNLNRYEEYLAPEIEVTQISVEGVLCASTELLEEFEGEW